MIRAGCGEVLINAEVTQFAVENDRGVDVKRKDGAVIRAPS